MNDCIFREYDIRGLVKTDLTHELVTDIGKAFGTILKRKGGKSVSIGGDVRLTTDKLKKYLITGITSCGIDVMDLGPCPTGAQYFSHFTRAVDAGIMVTGSHNPPSYNGFKMTMFKSNLFGDAIQHLLSLIKSKDYETGSGTIHKNEILSSYITTMRSKFNLKRELKVIIDYGNGAAALCGTNIYNNVDNLNVKHLFGKPDGTFPNHHPDPTVEENLSDLKKAVIEYHADFGIAFDGDADRIGIVDSDANVIWGDKLLIIYAIDALKRKKQDIIFDVKCSQALIEEIEKAGGKAIMSATGHSLLKQKMKECGAKIAGEMSGHMFFADDYYGFDDAIYAAIRFMNIISNSKQSIQEHLANITPYVATPEIRLEAIDDKEKFRIAKKAIKYFSNNYNCITVDGVRIQFNDGWGLIRSSNTQPVIVVRAEAKNKKRLNEIKNLIMSKLAEYGKLVEEEH